MSCWFAEVCIGLPQREIFILAIVHTVQCALVRDSQNIAPNEQLANDKGRNNSNVLR